MSFWVDLGATHIWALVRHTGPMYVVYDIQGHSSSMDDNIRPGHFEIDEVLKNTISGNHIAGWTCAKAVCVEYGNRIAAIAALFTTPPARGRNLRQMLMLKLALPQGSRCHAAVADAIAGNGQTGRASRANYRDGMRRHWDEAREHTWQTGAWTP
jgi:hypothetical protein